MKRFSLVSLKIYNVCLILLDQSVNTIIFSTGLLRENDKSLAMVAELLDTGNFMFIYSNNSESDDYLWESFNFSTNTLLPQMELRFGS